MQITVAELRAITERLYNHLVSQGHEVIEVPDVHYWAIPRKARVSQYDQPTEFSVGQTSDDWEELRRIGSEEAEPVGYALVWLASILREIGEQHVA